MSAISDPVPPARTRVVVLGASAGGVEALGTVVAGLADDLDAAVLVVLHVAAAGTSVLPAILARRTGLEVRAAQDGDQLRPGLVLVARPDLHLTLGAGGRVSVDRGPKENGHRPAVDTTMRSVAEHAGAGGAGVILSGTRDDGAAGLAAIHLAGGLTIIQTPDDALYPGMPQSALAAATPDLVLPAREIGAALSRRLTTTPPGTGPGTAAGPGLRAVPALGPVDETAGASPRGDEPVTQATRFTCPDCDGVLFEVREGGVQRFRCSVGHAYSHESLEVEQDSRMEHALWAAVRALEDRAVLLDRMASRSDDQGHRRSAAGFRARGAVHRENAELLRATVGFPAASVAAPPQSVDGTGLDEA